MNEDSMELEDRVRELILGGSAGRRELNELLRTNEAARPVAARLLVEEAALIAALRIDTVTKWADTLHPRNLPGTTGKATRPKSRRTLATVVAAAACMAAAALTLVKTREKPADSVAAAEVVIGIVTRLDQEGRGLPAARLLEKGAFVLDSGRARIDLDNGVVLSVAGPARLTIDLDHCRLWHGEIAVDIPKDLPTYVVETEDEHFVDLGNTFSVLVQPGRRTEITILQAPDQAERAIAEGADRSTKEAGRSESVMSGQTGGPNPIMPEDGRRPEARNPQADAAMVIPQAYRDAVMSSAPLVVWDFENELGPAAFPNRIGPSFPGRIHGRIRQSDGQGVNRYIVLGENEEDGWIESPDWWKKDDDAPFTIELWARPDRIHWGHLLNLRADQRIDPVTGREPGGPLSYFSLEMTHTRDFQPLPLEPSVRTTFRSPATEHPLLSTPGGMNLGLASPQRYLPGTWHHLVARVDRREFALFVNGKPVSRQAITVPRFGDVRLGLRVGALRHRGGFHRQFVGGIDEVAVYGRALSDSEIADHFSAAGSEP